MTDKEWQKIKREGEWSDQQSKFERHYQWIVIGIFVVGVVIIGGVIVWSVWIFHH